MFTRNSINIDIVDYFPNILSLFMEGSKTLLLRNSVQDWTEADPCWIFI